MVDALREKLGSAVLEQFIRPGDDVWVRVDPARWGDVARVLHDELGYTYFSYLSAVDWLPSPYGRGEDDPTEPPPERSTAIEQGYAGGETRFQMLACVYNPTAYIGLHIKADVAEPELRMPTWSHVYFGANWHEREAHEMFGIDFDGHPDLRHIYLPGDFEGYPLRKDFPLLSRMIKPWPGIVDVEPLPGGEDDAEAEGGTQE